jgi:hypothetical protein
MNHDKHIDLIAEAQAQFRWAVANIVIALLWVALVCGASILKSANWLLRALSDPTPRSCERRFTAQKQM